VVPAVADRVGGGGLILPIAKHDVRASNEDFAVVGNSHFDAREHRADGADSAFAARGYRDYRRSFGHAVAREERQAAFGVPGFNIGRDGRAATEQHFHLWAERGPERGRMIGCGTFTDALHNVLVDERHGVERGRLG
jgi:hypothetical protein